MRYRFPASEKHKYPLGTDFRCRSEASGKISTMGVFAGRSAATFKQATWFRYRFPVRALRGQCSDQVQISGL